MREEKSRRHWWHHLKRQPIIVWYVPSFSLDAEVAEWETGGDAWKLEAFPVSAAWQPDDDERLLVTWGGEQHNVRNARWVFGTCWTCHCGMWCLLVGWVWCLLVWTIWSSFLLVITLPWMARLLPNLLRATWKGPPQTVPPIPTTTTMVVFHSQWSWWPSQWPLERFAMLRMYLGNSARTLVHNWTVWRPWSWSVC